MKMEISKFIPGENVSHVEFAMITYDQWILTVALRCYESQTGNVCNMMHVIFDQPEGFRMLDEGAMLQFPWQRLKNSKSFMETVKQKRLLRIGIPG